MDRFAGLALAQVHEEFKCCASVDFLLLLHISPTDQKNIHFELVGGFKLPLGVNVRANGVCTL